MDIRVINEGRVVNVSELTLEAQGRYVVGLTLEGKQVLVKACESEEEAEVTMEYIIRRIEEGVVYDKGGIVIKLGKIEEGKDMPY